MVFFHPTYIFIDVFHSSQKGGKVSRFHRDPRRVYQHFVEATLWNLSFFFRPLVFLQEADVSMSLRTVEW